MDGWVRLVGPNAALEVAGVKLVGVTAENGKKFLFSLVFIFLLLLVTRGARLLARRKADQPGGRFAFRVRQTIHLFTACVLVLGLVSIWFDDPSRLATFVGLVSAGLAFALQRVITSLAGYFIILRGKSFNVGDRIVMGGVRGDVIAVGFFQTTIMEMGQPPSELSDGTLPTWIHARQYTGRIVTVTNDKIFNEPVYNYTRDFPYLWEEMSLPVAFNADRAQAERILLEAANRHSVALHDLGEVALREMERRYAVKRTDLGPKVYCRITDNWVELSVRFLVGDHAIREVKDGMSRDILTALDAAGIGIASSTFEIVGLPPLRLQGGMETLRNGVGRVSNEPGPGHVENAPHES